MEANDIPVEWVDAEEWADIESVLAAVGAEPTSSGGTKTSAVEIQPQGSQMELRSPEVAARSNASHLTLKEFRIKRCRRLLDYSTQCDKPFGGWSYKRRAQSKCKVPTFQFNGKIVYSKTPAEVSFASHEIKQILSSRRNSAESGSSLGFDIEWKASFQRGIPQGKAAVLQLCVDSSRCDVMHIFHSGIPVPLQHILEDVSIYKVGLGSTGDASKLYRDYQVTVSSVVDLSTLANRKLQASKGRSLSSLCKELTCKEVDKNNSIRMGNWEFSPLSAPQLRYAAIDAYASLHLYEVLLSFPDRIADKESANHCTGSGSTEVHSVN